MRDYVEEYTYTWCDIYKKNGGIDLGEVVNGVVYFRGSKVKNRNQRVVVGRAISLKRNMIKCKLVDAYGCKGLEIPSIVYKLWI